MDSMAYGYFAPPPQPQPQPYQYFGPASAPLHGSVPQDFNAPVQSMEIAIDGNAFYNFTTFDPSIGNSGMSSLPSTSASPPPHQHMSMISSGSVDSGIALDMDNEPSGRRGSSEEKESLTPAQSRRKAQNRAAQRAFRERKERHVRDLENKLNQLTNTTSSLQSDNERLKLMLQRAQTENEILRASARSPHTSNPHAPNFVDMPLALQTQLPSPMEEHRFDQSRMVNGLISAGSSPVDYSAPSLPNGSPILSAGAAWDFLQAHPLYLSGNIEIGEACEQLKKRARCDGMGPMFKERDVRNIIEELGRGGADDLL